jgi:hypothetical protein
VRRTVAVRRAEAASDNLGAGEFLDASVQLVLGHFFGVPPHLHDQPAPEKVVDVPEKLFIFSKMSLHPLF